MPPSMTRAPSGRALILATLLIGAGSLLCTAASDLPVTELTKHLGMCDASAAVALDADRFVVANDEDYRLRVYKFAVAQPTSTVVDLKPFMHVDGEGDEPDTEGAARIGNRIYWIASHGRNKAVERKGNRLRLFATDLAPSGALAPAGRPYRLLLDDVIAAFPTLPLAAAAAKAPEAEGGWNIEGLAAGVDGTSLLIGFRNPLPDGKAIVVELTNPAALVDAAAAPTVRATFKQPPSLLTLEKRGIRSFDLVSPAAGYHIVAGSPANERVSALFTWTGPGPGATLTLRGTIADLNPEGLLLRTGSRVYLLSDDGTDACQALPEAKRSFRMVRVAGLP